MMTKGIIACKKKVVLSPSLKFKKRQIARRKLNNVLMMLIT